MQWSTQSKMSLGWTGTTRHPPQSPKLHGSWLANQGISILAPAIFPSVMRMNWEGAVMAQVRLWGQNSRHLECNGGAPSSSVETRLGCFLPAEIWSRGAGVVGLREGSVVGASALWSLHSVPAMHKAVPSLLQGCPTCTSPCQHCTNLSMAFNLWVSLCCLSVVSSRYHTIAHYTSSKALFI